MTRQQCHLEVTRELKEEESHQQCFLKAYHFYMQKYLFQEQKKILPSRFLSLVVLKAKHL